MTRTWKAALLGLACLLLAGAVAPAARAQDTATAKAKAEKKKGGGPTVIDEIVIEGQVRKPQAFYLLERSSFGYRIMELEVKYTDAVVNSVKDEIF